MVTDWSRVCSEATFLRDPLRIGPHGRGDSRARPMISVVGRCQVHTSPRLGRRTYCGLMTSARGVPRLPEVWQSLPSDFARRLSGAALSAVDQAVGTKWESAKDRAKRITGESIDAKVSNVTSVFARELGLLGATTGGVAALPVAGTGTAVAAGIAEFSLYTVRVGELILTIGALHGHTEASVEEQRAWILSVLLFGNTAAEGFTKLAGEVGKGLGKKATKKIPVTALRAINHAASRTIVTKYGQKRGVIVLGRMLPFGIGALVGGSANYLTVSLLAKHANKFFTNLPYSSVLAEQPDPPDTTPT